MQKIKKIFTIFIVVLCLYTLPSFADVGDFETYSSGWSSSDSWDSGDSWSSWDDDDDFWGSRSTSTYSSDHFNTVFDMIFIIFGIAFLFIVFTLGYIGKKGVREFGAPSIKENKQEDIINSIRAIDEKFNPEEFTAWVKDLYIKMQYAWSDRDWESMRFFETKELYEQHARQIERYKQDGQINKIEGVSVNWVKFANFYQAGDKDVITVILNSKMIDYIIDEKTKNIIRGNNTDNKINDYKLTFVRTTGLKTEVGTKNYNVTNCPNCGAPTEITSSGKCSYCGSVIVIGKYDWILSSLERYNG